MIRRTALFDTLGDGMPGGILLEETVTSVNGPHPASPRTSTSAGWLPS